MARKGKSKSSTGKRGRPGKGTGKHERRAAPPAANGTPHPLVAGGIVVLVLGLLGFALAIAMRKPADPPHTADASPSVAAAEVERPQPRPEASRAQPEPSAKTAADGAAHTKHIPSNEDLLAELEGEPQDTPPPAKAPAAGDMATAPIRGEREDAVVDRVVDGDTLYLTDGRKVRLLGINTPERGRPFYKEAGNCLRELVDKANVTLEYGKERTGRYKRTLAYIHKDGVFVNAEIVRRGFAYAYLYPTTKLHNEELIRYQREARAAKRKLWSKPLPEPAPRYIGNRFAPYFHREGCGRLNKLRKKNRVDFEQRNDALDQGYNPCDDCKS